MQNGSRSASLERARSALHCIDPCGDDTWRKIGMALKDEFGEDAWPIFDEWSYRHDSYNARENRSRWNSFRCGGGITIATLFKLARSSGWRDDAPYPDPAQIAQRAKFRA